MATPVSNQPKGYEYSASSTPSQEYLNQLGTLYGKSRDLRDPGQRSAYVTELNKFVTDNLDDTSVHLRDYIEGGVIDIAKGIENGDDMSLINSGLEKLRTYVERESPDAELTDRLERFMAYIEQGQYGLEPHFSKLGHKPVFND
jgi:hypothetical protein